MEEEIRNKAPVKFNIKKGIEFYIPSLLTLIEGDIRWASLTKILENRHQDYTERFNNGEVISLRISLYSLVASAQRGNSEHIQLLSFIDNVFKSLSNLLSSDEKLLIKNNIANLLEYDEAFLNYLGELCVLNCLLASGICRLEATEYKLNQGSKSIDFKLLNKETKESLLVEVVNIELKDDKMVNHSSIQKFLEGKYKSKLTDTDKSGILDYTLAPVLWGGRDNLSNILKVKEFYEMSSFRMDRVQTPLVYMQLSDGNTVFNKFGSILNSLRLNS